MADERSLDPDDWDAVRRLFDAAIDRSLGDMRQVRKRPVWQSTPEGVRTSLSEPLPKSGCPLEDLLGFVDDAMRPYVTGNTHPRFFGWVHGSGNVAGVLGEMLAAFMDCNAGGRDHIAVYVERQVIAWSKELFGIPSSASGILTSGTSMGTLIALAAARSDRAPADVQTLGLAAAGCRLVGYASSEAHGSIGKAFALLGLGTQALRKVPTDGDFRMRMDLLMGMVDADRAAGLTPFVVIATAGSVNTGAIDPLADIGRWCRSQGLWLHVDAAFGGLAIAVPEFHPALAAIAEADSIAFDFHKWMHVPYDAGCVLVRDEAAHRRPFASRPHYLSSYPGGLARGEPWFCDYGPELSRGFRALKIWFTLKAYGMDRISSLIARNCAQARALALLIAGMPELQLLAAVSLNIVCFRFAGGLLEGRLDDLNSGIVCALQETGVAAPSTTRIDGKLAIRICLTNHRTIDADLQILVAEVLRLGRAASR